MNPKVNALIITDLQNDFMPWGALPVVGGDGIIPVILKICPLFSHIYTTQDWHPINHVSFAINHGKKPRETIQGHGDIQILWPVHCVQNTLGAALVPHLQRITIEKHFFKGTNSLVDSYSTFFDNEKKGSTGLGEYLKKHKIKNLFFSGLTTDYCILYSVLDALKEGFTVFVIQEACKGLNLQPEEDKKALVQMQDQGAIILHSKELSKYL